MSSVFQINLGRQMVLTLILPLLVVFSAAAHAIDVEHVVSPKGIEAWLVQDDTVPVVAMNFAFEGGTTQDPEGKEGLVNLLSSMLDEGAGDLSSEAYQEKMADLAISIGFGARADTFYGSLRTLIPARDEAFDLLKLALTVPRFDPAPLTRMKTAILAGIREGSQDPHTVGSQNLNKALFGNHPYALPSSGYEETVSHLTAEDLQKMKENLFVRSGLKIGVVGAIDAKTLGLLLDKVFSDLPEKGKLKVIPDITARQNAHVEAQMDIPQTTIMWALPGLKRDDPDYQAAYVMNHILGGGTFTSWLFEEIRDKRGLAYGASTFLAPSDHTGLLLGSAATRADRADETLELVLQQFERMATQGPTQDELESAKKYITGSYPLNFDTSGKIASRLVAIQNAGFGKDYLEKRNSEIEAVTLEDVQKVAKRLLQDKKPVISTVGPGK